LFTGQIRDLGDDRFYFFKSRYYDATIGKFHTPDSLVPDAGNPQALNRYAYALNNPLRLNDPTGHMYDDPSDGSLGTAGNTASSAASTVGTTAGDTADAAAGLAANHLLPQRYEFRVPTFDPNRPTDTQAMVSDMTVGRPGRGAWVLRFDRPDSPTPYYHVNTNRALTGYPDPIPHIRLSPAVVEGLGGGTRLLRAADRVALPVAVAGDTVQLGSAFVADNYKIGIQTKHAAGGVVGGWAGAFAGAWAGAQAGGLLGGAVGSVVVPAVGAVPGAALGGALGGIIGGIGGAFGGSALGESVADGL
jgi:RHS repeat-associated protein